MGKTTGGEEVTLPGGSLIGTIPMTHIAAVIEFIKMNNEPESKKKKRSKLLVNMMLN